MDLYAVRSRNGQLKAYTNNKLCKNNGAGYWLPEYNARATEILLNEEEFPEIQWDDAKPTRLELINPSVETTEETNIKLSNTIKVTIRNNASSYNTDVGTHITVFVDDISWIEPTNFDMCKTILHMKNGDNINCLETEERIRKLILNSQ